MNLEPPGEEAYRETGTSGRRLDTKSPIPDAQDYKLGRTVGGLNVALIWF